MDFDLEKIGMEMAVIDFLVENSRKHNKEAALIKKKWKKVFYHQFSAVYRLDSTIIPFQKSIPIL